MKNISKIAVGFLAISAAYLAYSEMNTAGAAELDTTGNLDAGGTSLDPGNDFSAMSNSLYYSIIGEPDMTDQGAKNLQAFLMTIRKWESSLDDSAYTMLYGGSHFNGFADHPRIAIPIRGQEGKYSTAAGAYQIVAISKTLRGMTKANTWDRIKDKLNLPDFSPQSQDLAAIELIKERGAYNLILQGKFFPAVDKIKLEWASVPGSPYGQGTAKFSEYLAAYNSFGGANYG